MSENEKSTNPKAKEVTKLTFQSMHIEGINHYRKVPKISARLSQDREGYRGLQEINIDLEPEVCSAIVQLLIPIVTMSASKAAQQLADDTKELATELSNRLLAAIPATLEIPSKSVCIES